MKALLRRLLADRRIQIALVLAVVSAAALAAKAYHDTMRDPVVQRLTIESEGLPAGAAPVTVAFLTDIHVAGPDMPPSRLERIVEQINALEPDLVAITGDLVSEKRTATHIYTPEEIVTPLGNLSARHGVAVVPGNHDHWYDWPALSAQLEKHEKITVLENSAAQMGPFAVAGLDDAFTGRDNVEATRKAMMGLEGIQLWLSHSPDAFPSIPVSAELVLAGHTHCGQIAYPWGGSPATMSEFGDLYACGVVWQHGKTLLTGAGLGTSLLPIRLFTQPEIWVIEVRPAD